MGIWLAVVSTVVLACTPTIHGGHAKPDAQSDALFVFPDAADPASCAAIHATNPALASGTYTIDPDGPGGDPSVSVTCDMQTDGGGWTIVYLPTSTDSSSATIAYTSSTPRLLGDATMALIAFRNASGVADANFATFEVPPDWRAKAPFEYASSDFTTGVSVNGGAPVMTKVRYGTSNFSNFCGDGWITASAFGRICVVNTLAPYYSGFAIPNGDWCSSSQDGFKTAACGADRQFSIAVR